MLRSEKYFVFFFLMIRRPPRSTLDRSSAASDVYKRQIIFKAAFYKDVSRLKMWNAFLTKIKAENISFETVIKRIEQLIKAVF